MAFTCLYTRAVNLKITRTANVKDFIRAVQLHCLEYGIFQSCLSDLGSQIQAGANIITNFLNDPETSKYLSCNHISKIEFQHYAKGNSSLGSIIETIVKQVKFLVFKSIGKTILELLDFELLIAKAVYLINKRPIAFKDGLRTLDPDDVPTSITPELLIRGDDTPGLGIIPQLQPLENEKDVDYGNDSIEVAYGKLRRTREKFLKLYHGEFLTTLIHQAVDKPGRYKPKKHQELHPGDVVLLVDKFQKQYNYPMGRILSVEKNSLGEVTAANVLKGDTRERVYRHSSSLIFLFSTDAGDDPRNTQRGNLIESKLPLPRSAASACRERNKSLSEADLI